MPADLVSTDLHVSRSDSQMATISLLPPHCKRVRRLQCDAVPFSSASYSDGRLIQLIITLESNKKLWARLEATSAKSLTKKEEKKARIISISYKRKCTFQQKGTRQKDVTL